MTAASTPSFRAQLIGTWELSACCASLPEDESDVVYPLGREAKGFIIYTDDGYMSTQLAAAPTPEHPDKANQNDGPIPDYIKTWGTYIAYTGPFYLDERGDKQGRPILLHKMQSSNISFLLGETQRRIFEVLEQPTGRYLVLSVEEPAKVNGEYRLITVRWRKVSSNTALPPDESGSS